MVLPLGWEIWEEVGGKELVQTEVWILVSQSGIEPVPTAVEAWGPNHWTAREAPGSSEAVTFADVS